MNTIVAKNKENKVEVINPIKMLNPIGEELYNIFLSHKKDITALNIPSIEKKENISKANLNKAAKLLELDNSFVESMINYQNNYQKSKKQSEDSYKKAKKYFHKFKTVLPIIRKEELNGFDLLDDIVNFFGVDSEEEILNYTNRTKVLYRIQNQASIDEINLCAFIRRGEIDCKSASNTLNYDQEKLNEWLRKGEWRDKINEIDYFKSLPNTFKEFGICLILLPYLPKTVYGGVSWIEGKPIIMVSDREHDLSTCWLTLFHELGHVLKHNNIIIFDSDLSKTKSNKIETEANKFAYEYLFNGDELRKEIFYLKQENSYTTIEKLSEKYQVNPIFVSYWMRKAQYYPKKCLHNHIEFQL